MELTENITIERQISQLEKQIRDMQKKAAQLRRTRPPEETQDYTFYGPGGVEIKLSDLFGHHKDLILIHNMGKSCAHCTLWADGFNGLLPHLENRAAFVMISPDDPKTQHEFAFERGWKFKFFSAKSSTFMRDMGFETDDGKFLPGVSTFHKEDSGKIVRVSRAEFCPGDEFCSAWHLFSMLFEGVASWEPKYTY